MWNTGKMHIWNNKIISYIIMVPAKSTTFKVEKFLFRSSVILRAFLKRS